MPRTTQDQATQVYLSEYIYSLQLLSDGTSVGLVWFVEGGFCCLVFGCGFVLCKHAGKADSKKYAVQ